MLKVTIKSILGRKIRFALTSFAIIIGVAFSVASFVLSDSLRTTFNMIATTIGQGTDLTVRTRLDFGDKNLRPPVPTSILAMVQSTPGVKLAVASLGSPNVVPFKADGKPLTTTGAPLLGVNYIPTAGKLSQLLQRAGRAPSGPNEFNLDITTANREGFKIGQTYTIAGPAGSRQFTLVGTVAFGTPENTLAGAVLSAFDTPTAQDFLAKGDFYDSIAVAVDQPGDVKAVAQRLESELPQNFEAVTNDVTIQEAKDQFSTIVTIFGSILLAFAIVMVVVAAFIINNTFTIVLGQRVRELALLRALGASSQQVTRSVIGEAFLVGAFSTIVGFGAGIGLSFGLHGLLNALNFGLPSGPIEIRTRTVVVAILIGVGITVLVSLAPARRVRRVPPVAALRDDYHIAGVGLRRRIIAGTAATVMGAGLMSIGLFGGLATVALLGNIAAGALLIFVGVNLLSPMVARPVAYLLGVPLRAGTSVAGRLAQENAARNPRRTASTASALMIGLALVSMASVIGASLTTSFIHTLDTSLKSDLIVQPKQQNNQSFTSDLAPQLGQLPGIAHAVPFRIANNSARIGGNNKSITATDLSQLDSQLNIDVKQGSLANLTTHSLLVKSDAANNAGIKLGDSVPVLFQDGQTDNLTVAAIYGNGALVGNWIIDLSTWNTHFPTLNNDFLVSMSVTPGADPDQVRSAVEQTIKPYPVKVENRAELKASAKKQVNSLLSVIQVFLAISLAIAALGIANTLALSIFERTRELGLLRAVGMTRRQMKRMIRTEAVIVAIFGGLLGVVLGVIFGIASTAAIPKTIINTVSVPVAQLIGYLIVAIVIGVLAAYLPARRAAKLDVLTAISRE